MSVANEGPGDLLPGPSDTERLDWLLKFISTEFRYFIYRESIDEHIRLEKEALQGQEFGAE